MATIETISIVFTGISISLAAFYYINTLRNTRRNQELQLETRQAQLFTQLYSEFRRPETLRLYFKALQMTWDDYDDFVIKYSLENWEERVPMMHMSLFYEEIGALLEEGLIDVNLVLHLIGGAFRLYWEKFKPYVLERRIRDNNPRYFDKVEYLYNEIEKLRGHEWKEIFPELKT
jgi:hypothetical protein